MIMKARTKIACAVVGIDRQKLTDAINSGDYNCAPETTQGRARVFDIDDMSVLFIYERLTQRGIPSKRAGGIAAHLRGEMNITPEAGRIGIRWAISGAMQAFAITDKIPDTRQLASYVPLLVTEIYDVENVRNFIRERLAEESEIAGDEE